MQRRYCLALVILMAGSLGAGIAIGRALDDIRARGLLSLCAHPNALPFASKSGPRRGIQIELAEAIAERLGVALKVEWVTLGFQYRDADCDIVMDTIVDPEALQERNLKWSRPYQRSGVALGVRAGVEGVHGFGDLNGTHRVGVQVGSLAHMILSPTGATAIPFGFEDEMLAAVSMGEIDAAAASPTSIGYWNQTHPEARVHLYYAYEAEPELAWDLAVGMRRSDRFLRKEMDRVVDELLRDGMVARTYAAYGIEHRAPQTEKPPRIERKSTVGEETCVRLGYARECRHSP